MQDFSLGPRTKKEEREKEAQLNMSVSPVFERDGEKKAYVSFSDPGREAEALIPDCEIIKQKGFSEEEVEQLKEYLEAQKDSLMQTASKLNVMDAFMKEK